MDDIYVSQQKLDELKKEYASLSASQVKENEESTQRGGPMDSFKEAAAFSASTQAKGSKIDEIKNIIDNAKILPDDIEGDKIVLGKWFIIRGTAGERQYRLVDAVEAEPDRNLISLKSPLGEAATGKCAGEKFILNGVMYYVVKVI